MTATIPPMTQATSTTDERRILGLPSDWIAQNGQPIDLTIIPDGPQSYDDPGRYERQDDWKRWYDEVRRYRLHIVQKVEAIPELAEVEIYRCLRDPLYFMCVYAWIYETREGQGLGSGFLPAIPFPFQYDLVRWLERRMQGRGAAANGFISKSRDMGATWECVLFVLHQFLFTEPFIAKLISRREDLVDNPGDMDSMMERISANMELLPPWMLPPGWSILKHRGKNKILHTRNKNAINGESTSKRSGRGGRSTMILVDEAAFIDNFRFLIGSITQTSPHVILVSSESIETSEDYIEYYKALEAKSPDTLLQLDYWKHPYHDQDWLDEQRERYAGDEGAFQREIMRQPYAGVSALLYPEARDKTPIDSRWEYDGIKDGFFVIDPGYDDETALGIVIEDYEPGRDLVYDFFEARHAPPEFYAAILCGCHDDILDQFTVPDFTMREAKRWAAMCRELPPFTIYGDPAGHQHHHGGDSWYDRMILFALDHNTRKNPHTQMGQPLVIELNWNKKTGRDDQGRRAALMNWLRQLDFNDNEQARMTLTAVQRSRFDEQPARGRATEQRNAKHDQYCVTGDTRIRTLSGWVPIQEMVGKENQYVWAYSTEQKRIVPAKASDAFLSAKQAQIIEVGIDDGTSIKCTPNHLFMLRDGSYIEAKDLVPGDSLMPFYERGASQEYQIIDLNDGTTAVEHKYVYHWFHGPPPTGWHIHHKNENKRDNQPENLEALSIADHCKITLRNRHKDKAALSVSAKKAAQTAKDRYRIEKQCGLCGKDFIGDWRTLYCSKQCKYEVDNARRNAEKEKTFEEKPCKICGTIFRGAPRRKTCSPECQEENWRIHTGRTPKRAAGLAGVATNHKVTFIRDAGYADVYDLTVPETSNFVAEGVILHNSHRRTALEYGAVNLEIRRLGKQVRAKRQREAGHAREVAVGRTPGFRRERQTMRRN